MSRTIFPLFGMPFTLFRATLNDLIPAKGHGSRVGLLGHLATRSDLHVTSLRSHGSLLT
ncbi:hypothetical protein E2C01_061687 [Portunus trituberculatus]|uniref:Uncharacterized protein n=1 Tax=Portunus trituberculatus TaxID=210409 RepID=A0A5B7H5X4_PORTR|nr:hypothetical protein [Portunus trituberculatus]